MCVVRSTSTFLLFYYYYYSLNLLFLIHIYYICCILCLAPFRSYDSYIGYVLLWYRCWGDGGRYEWALIRTFPLRAVLLLIGLFPFQLQTQPWENNTQTQTQVHSAYADICHTDAYISLCTTRMRNGKASRFSKGKSRAFRNYCIKKLNETQMAQNK